MIAPQTPLHWSSAVSRYSNRKTHGRVGKLTCSIVHIFVRFDIGGVMESDRARLQRRITAHGYHAFALALQGPSDAVPQDEASYPAMESLARAAIRRHMAQGFSEAHSFMTARDAAARHLANHFASAAPIHLDFAADELLSLILEELGQLPPTLD